MKKPLATAASLALAAGVVLAAALPAKAARSGRFGFRNVRCSRLTYKGAVVQPFKIIIGPGDEYLGCAKTKAMLRSYYDHMAPRHYRIGRPVSPGFPHYGVGPGLSGAFVRAYPRFGSTPSYS
jgi:hypothetical protein